LLAPPLTRTGRAQVSNVVYLVPREAARPQRFTNEVQTSTEMLSVALQQAAQLLTDLRDVPEVDTEILLAVTIRARVRCAGSPATLPQFEAASDRQERDGPKVARNPRRVPPRGRKLRWRNPKSLAPSCSA